jgi:ppGpp synthetase/RelA/SpoT-type nucleotidyltranferase
MNLESILTKWYEEKPLYEIFTKRIESVLEEIGRSRGILVRVVSRTKDDVSIAKKLYRKGVTYQNYLEMNDKAGARVICRFKEDTQVIAACIKEEFVVLKEDNKRDLLKLNEFGYKSLHFDIKLKREKTSDEDFEKIGNLTGEIQVRTLCEDVWAEINHDIGYKPLVELSPESARQIYCLGGLFEVADDCFSNINTKILESSTLDEYSALKILESPFIRLVKKEYDRGFSYKSLKVLLPLLGTSNPTEFERTLKEFIDRNNDKIRDILDERKIEINYFPYLTQPELFLIFLLIERDVFSLKVRWEEAFPIEDLEKICTWWGKPISDILELE